MQGYGSEKVHGARSSERHGPFPAQRRLDLEPTSVLLDVLTEDAQWYEWSSDALETHAESSILAINPIIYAEVSIRFRRIEDVEEALPPDLFQRAYLPWEAAFLAGKSFVRYRRKGGVRRSPPPDFYIGAHAAVNGWKLLTRDAGLYQTYFPGLPMVSPPRPTSG